MYHMKQHRHRMADAKSLIFDVEYIYKYNVIFGSTLCFPRPMQHAFVIWHQPIIRARNAVTC